uniref:Uncharacterized protein n=1 Tax=Oryza sativa subsp. japonica TaxID=39947 RepID=Q6UU31_ORYSJ|nr:hypothetical protein OSJNBa0096K16.12 [Oryza sativa Japonica Group]
MTTTGLSTSDVAVLAPQLLVVEECQTSGLCRGLYNYSITREWLVEFDKDYGIKAHHIPNLIWNRTSYIEGVPDKVGQIEFKLETIRTTRIVSIFISLVLLGQGDIYGYEYKTP